MRKITEEAARAFANAQDWKLANTQVFSNGGAAFMELHGNKIAERGRRFMTLTLAGWPTRTTRERLNGLLDYYGFKFRFYQHQHTQFFGGVDITGQKVMLDLWNLDSFELLEDKG